MGVKLAFLGYPFIVQLVHQLLSARNVRQQPQKRVESFEKQKIYWLYVKLYKNIQTRVCVCLYEGNKLNHYRLEAWRTLLMDYFACLNICQSVRGSSWHMKHTKIKIKLQDFTIISSNNGCPIACA